MVVRGGSCKLALVCLIVHAPSKNSLQFCEHKHTSLIFLVGKFSEERIAPLKHP
jgi:hypothetical protein